jgi:hypothetical protein
MGGIHALLPTRNRQEIKNENFFENAHEMGTQKDVQEPMERARRSNFSTQVFWNWVGLKFSCTRQKIRFHQPGQKSRKKEIISDRKNGAWI